MTLRVVLYAEGAGEMGTARWPTPGHPLLDEHLGAGHHLVRRVAASTRAVPEAAILFQSPLVLRSKREPRGSDLHDPSKLSTLLVFLSNKPNLCVVLVDADGDASERRARMQTARTNTALVVAIAVEEFEGWLIADSKTASDVLGVAVGTPPEPENLRPGEAKELWARWTQSLSSEERAQKREELARRIDLSIVEKRSASFARFVRDMRPAS